jgi:glycosyltransferase involved in cell wall biosynthesis
MTEVIVSVIVPVYNLEKYIDRCLLSIRNQTLKEIEIIIVDDGSIDHSLKKIKKHAESDMRIQYVNQENKGVSSARNKGIELAIGKYITFIDGDDYIESDMLEKMYSLSRRNNFDLTFCLFRNSNLEMTFKTNTMTANDYIRKVIDGDVQRSACGALFSLALLKQNSLYFDIDMSYGEDMIFTIKALLVTKKDVGIDLNEYYVVENRPGSAIRKMNSDQFKRIQLLAQKLDEAFENTKLKHSLELSLHEYYFFDILRSISHIVNSEDSMSEKFDRIKELKKSPLSRKNLNIKFKSSISVKLKSNLIKCAPPVIIWFIYKLNNTIKRK